MNYAQLNELASGLHEAAGRMLRMARREPAPISAPRLSALSALALGGPMSLTELAAAGQVKAPTMSRIVEGLVKEGLATREADPANRRKVRIAATEEGKRRLEAGREGRVRALRERLRRLADSEQRALARGVEVLGRVLR
jgi:DNA-binding MarR family transcriptional regulator